jgi:hypothetical protein
MSEPTADDVPDIQDLVSEIGEDPSEIAEIIAEDVVDPNTLPTHAQRAMLSALLVEATERLYPNGTLQEAFTQLMEERTIRFTTGIEDTGDTDGLKISGSGFKMSGSATISGEKLTLGEIDPNFDLNSKEKNDSSRKGKDTK